MLRKTLGVTALLVSLSMMSAAQILGGGTQFSNAVLFNQSWLTGCPSAGTLFSNQAAFEPNTAMDPCAPAPSCVTGTTGSDVWFSFFAQATTAKIVVNPAGSFNVAIQAFSGSECPGLTEIGCIDAGGDDATETLNLSGLTINKLYYFRIFGLSVEVANRATYTFCGSTQLGSSVLSAEIFNFNTLKQNNTVILNWATGAEVNNAYFEIERSSNANNFETIGRVTGAGTIAQLSHYSFTDVTPLLLPINYYRLKIVSNNGSYKYSPVAIVRMNSKLQKAVTVLSNPVTDNLSVKISTDVAVNTQLKIMSNSGKLICTQYITVTRGDNIITVNNAAIQNLASGMYTLQVMLGNELLNTKFIKIQ